jgi:hypothetical protein
MRRRIIIVSAAAAIALVCAQLASPAELAEPAAAPMGLSPEQTLMLQKERTALQAMLETFNAHLNANKAQCGAIDPEDRARVAECDRSNTLLQHEYDEYSARLDAYRTRARRALEGRISDLDRDLASVQKAIRNIGFGSSSEAFGEFEELSQSGKDAMVDEAVGSMLTVVGSPEVGQKLSEVFDQTVSKRLISPASWNPWSVNGQIREMERLGVTDPYFHDLMRKVAATKNKREYVESATALMKYAVQGYKDSRALYKVGTASDWRERNWAMVSASLTFLSDKTYIRPERAVTWLGMETGKKALLGFKAAMSATNVAFRYYQAFIDLQSNLEEISALPEHQLQSLVNLDKRLKGIVGQRNEAKKELLRFD